MDQSAAGLAFLLMMFGCVCSLFLNTTFYGNAMGGTDGSVGGVNEHHLFLLGPDGQILNAEERPSRTPGRPLDSPKQPARLQWFCYLFRSPTPLAD